MILKITKENKALIEYALHFDLVFNISGTNKSIITSDLLLKLSKWDCKEIELTEEESNYLMLVTKLVESGYRNIGANIEAQLLSKMFLANKK